ncbi:MAG: hypothetical protein KAS32_30110 [Candidatus Peribacteraceae bacterium]|nr:hypothetical protein [Candidatus Peribacteraceae bacterium]
MPITKPRSYVAPVLITLYTHTLSENNDMMNNGIINRPWNKPYTNPVSVTELKN